MDNKEFRILCNDLLDGVEDRINRLTVDDVDAVSEDGVMRICFRDGTEVSITRNDEFQRLSMNDGNGLTHFYFNETEEAWFGVGSETPLLFALQALITKKTGVQLRLTEE